MEKQKHSFFRNSLIFLLLSYPIHAEPAKFIAPDLEEPKKPITAAFTIDKPNGPIKEGSLFSVSITGVEPIEDVSGEFQERFIDFFPDPIASEENPGEGNQRFSAIIGVNYGTPSGEEVLKIKAINKRGEHEYHVNLLVEAGEFPSEKLRVPPRTISPKKKDLKKIAKDRILIGKIYSKRTEKKYWEDEVILPVKSKITSQFGTFRVYNGKKLNAHLGTDLRAWTGTPIRAPVTGKVALARYLFFTGNTVILDHGYGFFTVYGHMSKLKVKEGQIAKKGRVLGLAGKTGRASGPHLHWGLHLHGAKVDPMALLDILK